MGRWEFVKRGGRMYVGMCRRSERGGSRISKNVEEGVRGGIEECV